MWDLVWLNELFSFFKLLTDYLFDNCRCTTRASRVLWAWSWNMPLCSMRNRVSTSRRNSVMGAILFFLHISRLDTTLIVFHEEWSLLFILNTVRCVVSFFLNLRNIFIFFALESLKFVCEDKLISDRRRWNWIINWMLGFFSDLRIGLAFCVIRFFRK
jgi:hypothetical protein